MTETVKRRYDSTRRAARAEQTRSAILRAASEAFTRHGYAKTSIARIAADADVNVDTVYAAAGRKPQLMLAVIDMALAGGDRPVGAEQRDYVQAIHAQPTARGKLETYAAALGPVLARVAPLFDALAQAALTDPDCRGLEESIDQRRLANMRLLAAELRATGPLRSELSDSDVADLLWTTNSPAYFALTQQRGWTPEQYAVRVGDLWVRTLLDS